MRPIICALGTVAILAPIPSASAQGNGHAYGLYKNPHPTGSSAAATASGPSGGGSQEIQAPGTGTRNFGSWLDDASVMDAGNAYVNVGVGFWRMTSFHEFDAPMIDTGVALNRRVQVGVSVPYYRASEPGGPVASGFGTVYLSTKVQLQDAAAHRVGFAVSPAVEILGAAPAEGRARVSFALPVSVEVQRSGWRSYASTGYFSRGALFASGAVEKAITARSWLTGTISHSHSIDPDPLSAALGLAQTRTDISGGGTVLATPKLAIYASIGRTISQQDPNSASLMLTGGVSFNFLK